MHRLGVPAVVATVAFLIFATPEAAAYSIPSSPGFSFSVEVSGLEEINVLSSPSAAAFQGSGVATIQIHASWSPGESGSGSFIVNNSWSPVPFDVSYGSGWGTATAIVDMSSFSGSYVDFFVSGTAYSEITGQTPSDGFETSIRLYKKQYLSLPSGDGDGNLWVVGRSQLCATVLNVKVTPAYNWAASTETWQLAAGETVTPSAPDCSFDPESATTDDLGRACFTVIPNQTDSASTSPRHELSARAGMGPLGWIPSHCTGTAVPASTVTVKTGRGTSEERQVVVPYARIVSFAGDVRVKSALGGDWLIAEVGCSLGKGDTVFLGPMNPQTYERSYVQIDFYNLMTGEVFGSFSKEGTSLYLRLGDYVEVKEYTVLNDATNLAFDVAQNTREWLKSGITYGVGKGIKYATGGYGWIASTAAGALVKFGIRKMDAWATSPNLRLAPQMLESKAKINARRASLAPLATTPTANLYTTVSGDGSTGIVNRGEALMMTDGVTVGIIPAWSTASLDIDDAAQTPVNGTPMYIPEGSTPTIEITPAHGSAIEGLQPKIVFDYPEAAFYPVMPETFVARLNGYLVSPYMLPGTTQTSWYPFAERPLPRGSNTVNASIRTVDGARARSTATFTASAPQPAAGRPVVHAGTSAILVRWEAVRDPDVVGYRVYRSTLDGIDGTEISSGVLGETVFVDTTAAAATTYYYQVATVDRSGSVSQLSVATRASLDPSAFGVAPAPVPALEARAGDGRVTLDFEPSAGTLAFRVERRIGAGTFANVLPGGGLVARSPFVDRGVTNGTDYSYRITPLGIDLAAGESTLSVAITPTDIAPAAPRGVTALEDRREAVVEWDPSSEDDVVGYHIENARPLSGFVRVTAAPVSATSFRNTPSGGGVVGWRVIAVDAAGQESKPSEIATTSIAQAQLGDTDGDGILSPTDIVYLINYIFGAGPEPVGSGDVNGDGLTNVLDVFFLINYLFTSGY